MVHGKRSHAGGIVPSMIIRYTGNDKIMKKRYIYIVLSIMLFGIEILIGLFAGGWIRSYLGDVLVVILLYTICRMISPEKPERWFVLPSVILGFSFVVEFLQLWGFCDRFGITNTFLRILIGTGFSVVDLVCYSIGIIPCYVAEFLRAQNPDTHVTRELT